LTKDSISLNDPVYVARQYQAHDNLDARISLHVLFSTAEQDWYRWLFNQLEIPPGSHILELGCGSAQFWERNKEHLPADWQVLLSDKSAGMVEQAQATIHSLKPAFSLAQVDAQAIPFPDASFPVVLANHMLYHVPDRAKAIRELRRVLQPGGRLYASTAGKYHMSDLETLLHEFDPSLPREEKNNPFVLENGPGQLGAYFSQVETRRHSNDLRITRAGPLVDYVFSWEGYGVDEARRQAFKDFIEAKLAVEGGVIHIRKDTGLLLAY